MIKSMELMDKMDLLVTLEKLEKNSDLAPEATCNKRSKLKFFKFFNDNLKLILFLFLQRRQATRMGLPAPTSPVYQRGEN